VAGRVARLDEQAEAVLSRNADVVCLQEVTKTTLPRWREILGPSLCRIDEQRRLSVLLTCGEEAEAPVVERPESARAVRWGGALIVGAHVPNAANGWVKVTTLAALAAHMTRAAGPRILCGDLNAPRRELPDGTLWSFARDGKGRLREERGEPWEEGELAPWRVLDDAFRRTHPYGHKEVSWAWPHGGGWRLDHVLVSPEVVVERCEYLHAWREDGLSDHSAMECDLTW
jgi:endonuclease/exonuclease/phosphatase family metal-dependent hydrolase